MADPQQLCVPPFITISHVGDGTGAEAYTISNEASGRYFTANASTVGFLEAVNRLGALAPAAAQLGLPGEEAERLAEQMLKAGVLVEPGKTYIAPPAKAPVESRLISFRFDLIDAAPLARRLSWLGWLLFSPLGFGLWALLVLAAVTAILRSPDKMRYAMEQVPETGLSAVVVFLTVYVGLKVVHEMGHALAYQRMCQREGLAPGPIRMGISSFALTPFPFTDVTGAWRLKSRRARALIGAGGLYAEFFAVALITLLWAATGIGPYHAVLFQVAIFATASSILFNLNPVVKLDGYYIFSDLFGQPNMTGQGSRAARTWFARRLGAPIPPPKRWALGYWGLSYLYRWTIFAGVFWLAYQFDQRLAVPMVLVVFMMLVVRPLTASIAFARAVGIKPRNASLALCALAALTAGLLLPFRDRVLLPGVLHSQEARYVRATETAQLALGTDGTPAFESAVLDYETTDLKLRLEMLENAARATAVSGQDQARLTTDLTRAQELLAQAQARRAALALPVAATARWTSFDAERYDRATLRGGQNHILGAITSPTAPRLTLWMAQDQFQEGLLATPSEPLPVRMAHDPACQFEATLEVQADDLTISQEALRLEATPRVPLPECAAQAPNGAALVARLPAPPRSILSRVWRRASHALQDRLPVEHLTRPHHGQ